MEVQKVNAWIQIATSLAVVIGLALVIWELQQNREATQSQLTTEGLHMMNQFHTSVLGEHPADVLAKSLPGRACMVALGFTGTDALFYFANGAAVITVVGLHKPEPASTPSPSMA